MPPPLGHAPEPENPKPSPLPKELPVAVTNNPYPLSFVVNMQALFGMSPSLAAVMPIKKTFTITNVTARFGGGADGKAPN
jgi:hypothetical protein